MSNFSPKLEDSSDKQLWRLINESNPNYTLLASDELTRRTMDMLNGSIKKLDEGTGRYNQFLIVLTWVMFLLTVVTLVANFQSMTLRFSFIGFFAIWSIIMGWIIFKK